MLSLSVATVWAVSSARYEASAETLDRAEDLRAKLTQQALSSDPRVRLNAQNALHELTAYLTRVGKTFADSSTIDELTTTIRWR